MHDRWNPVLAAVSCMQVNKERAMIKTWAACAAYAVPIALVAWAGSWLDDHAMTRAVLAAVVSGLVALALSQTRVFEKDAVDIVYYGVAMAGVLVYFAQEGALRAERAVDTRITQLEAHQSDSRKAVTEFDSRTEELVALEADRDALRERILTDPGTLIFDIQEAEIRAIIGFTTVEALVCADALGVRRLRTFDDYEGLPGAKLREDLNTELAIAACAEAQARRKAEQEAARSVPITLDVFTADSARFAPIEGMTVTAAGQKMTVGALLEVLSDAPLMEGRADERAALVLRSRETEDVLATARKNREPDKAAARGSVSPLVWALRYQGWPYVLIWLLSLKLARSRVT